MLGSFLTAIDWFGTAVFAVTGALVEREKGSEITKRVRPADAA